MLKLEPDDRPTFKELVELLKKEEEPVEEVKEVDEEKLNELNG